MTNPDSTLVGVLVDRSGSMSSIRDDMEGGINTFIASQKGQGGTALVTLADFDTEYRVVFNAKNVDTEELHYTLEPRGGTALNDSMGRFITEIGRGLKKLPEAQRPGKVVILVVTDGRENASSEYTTAMVKKMVTEQQDTWNWEFVFLGKDIDSFAQAGSWGIKRESTMDFRNAPLAMATVGEYVTNTRSGMTYAQNVASTINLDENRKAAMDEEE